MSKELTPEEQVKIMPGFVLFMMLDSFGFSGDEILNRIQFGIAIMSAFPLTPMYPLQQYMMALFG